MGALSPTISLTARNIGTMSASPTTFLLCARHHNSRPPGVLRVDTRLGWMRQITTMSATSCRDTGARKCRSSTPWSSPTTTPSSRTLQGNKRSPFDGKIGPDGSKQRRRKISRKSSLACLAISVPARACWSSTTKRTIATSRTRTSKAEGEDAKTENDAPPSGSADFADHAAFQSPQHLRPQRHAFLSDGLGL